VEHGEQCDAGSKNGVFYGNGKGCSKTCTLEPTCQDSSGKTQACTTACGDGNINASEECDDGNQLNGDGCSSTCKVEAGFSCMTTTVQAASTCQSGAGQCLALSMIYRDFQPEDATSGGHPDFFFLGTKAGASKSPTTVCVPNSAGPSHGNDSTARCWGIAAPTLSYGKPQPGSTTTCDCQFSDWNINSSHIPGAGYTESGNDSPLSDGNGGYLGASAGTTFTVAGNAGNSIGAVTCYNSDASDCSGGGPIWKGKTPAYKDANSFNQWFNDDPSVNRTFASLLEMSSIGTNIYQYASTSHLAQGGFFPLDALNPSQATLCNLWPYWNHGDGKPIFATCQGDQYLFPPRIIAGDCGSGASIASGCWVSSVAGVKHDSYFTTEARYYLVYDGAAGFSLSFYGDDDLFVFINGNLVLDLGGVHQQLPGKITVSGSPGDASVTEGGCLDPAGNITGFKAGSNACSPAGSSSSAPAATSPDDFRVRSVTLGLVTGKVYEIAVFGADRHPPESNYQLTLNGAITHKSVCNARCGDGVVSSGEECDCGDGSVLAPASCVGPNSDTTYGGCTTQCMFGPFCGDGIVNGSEECDNGPSNGTISGKGGCTVGCTKTHFCGDGVVDANLGEQCDLGSSNGQPGQLCDSACSVVVLPAG
jgi:cysteine-rich repeat protein